ncbi:hypothetical protein NIE88_01960 [Sporolactobacillus shoreicorticis]|uniref:Uncharacterized protein n=1 Tax=Sporolactobacillus shoreicorticis TaxID=1923877 RepID=A0ABW5S1A5_9BACL|nr:hypothetical protein [Sporolactobacillus shoreicorticis]MCO7124544.1 hypothetical protein [Sporolactobacillus shoreicorticis]
MAEFAKLTDRLDEIQSAYLGMVIDPDSLTLTHYGDSYQRGIKFRLVYDKSQKQWLVDGISDNYITWHTASFWTHKKELTVPNPIVRTWPANKQPNL